MSEMFISKCLISLFSINVWFQTLISYIVLINLLYLFNFEDTKTSANTTHCHHHFRRHQNPEATTTRFRSAATIEFRFITTTATRKPPTLPSTMAKQIQFKKEMNRLTQPRRVEDSLDGDDNSFQRESGVKRSEIVVLVAGVEFQRFRGEDRGGKSKSAIGGYYWFWCPYKNYNIIHIKNSKIKGVHGHH